MKIISAITIAMLPLAASAATLIIPAAGTGPGAYESHWQSELTLHNTSASAVTVGVKFHDRNGAQSGDDIRLNARNTVTVEDIVATRFGRDSATGALELTINDAAANKVAITSRTFNRSAAGEFVEVARLPSFVTFGESCRWTSRCRHSARRRLSWPPPRFIVHLWCHGCG